MKPFSSDPFDIKQVLKNQKLRFHAEVRAAKNLATFSAKRNIFIGSSIPNSDISSLLSLFNEALKNDLIQEMLNSLKPMNNYLYDCSKDEVSRIFKEFAKNDSFIRIIQVLQKNDEDFSIINEVFMLFVNFSALLEEKQDLLIFFESISEEIGDLLIESRYSEIKSNVMVMMGNLMIKDQDLAVKILEESSFFNGILIVVRQEKNELQNGFFNALAWFLDILLDFPAKTQCFVKF